MLSSGTTPKIIPVAADSELLAERGYLYGAVVTAGANAGVLTLYDGALADGKKLLPISCPVNDTREVMFQKPVSFATLRSALSGTGVVAIAYIGT